jgi:hypothetical protein
LGWAADSLNLARPKTGCPRAAWARPIIILKCWCAGLQAIYPAADWHAGAHANLRLACTRGLACVYQPPFNSNLTNQPGSTFFGFFFSFIIILAMFHCFFLSALPLPQNEYLSFCVKKQFHFLFLTYFEYLLFIFVVSNSISSRTYSAPLDQVLLFQVCGLKLWNPKQASRNYGAPTVPIVQFIHCETIDICNKKIIIFSMTCRISLTLIVIFSLLYLSLSQTLNCHLLCNLQINQKFIQLISAKDFSHDINLWVMAIVEEKRRKLQNFKIKVVNGELSHNISKHLSQLS